MGETRVSVKNGTIKDIIGVDCDTCQHKDVCRFCETAETFVRDMKGEYPTGGSAPFILNVTCTHKTSIPVTKVDVFGNYPKAVPTLTGGETNRLVTGSTTTPSVGTGYEKVTVSTTSCENNGSDKTDPTKVVTREL